MIVAVGVKSPSGRPQIIDATGKVVTPGLINHTELGVIEDR
jgi:imidazolonepropionase-like amidohydrolase